MGQLLKLFLIKWALNDYSEVHAAKQYVVQQKDPATPANKFEIVEEPRKSMYIILFVLVLPASIQRDLNII